jgi:hypothetical protein
MMMRKHNQNDHTTQSAGVVNIMSRNSEIAYRLYKKRLYDAVMEYNQWRKEYYKTRYAGAMEWRTLLEGKELEHKAAMWFRVCAHLKEHIKKPDNGCNKGTQ